MTDIIAQAQDIELDKRSRTLRQLIIDSLQSARRGHIGASFSPLEVIRVLYDDVMRYKPGEPSWTLRDRFILSKGHGCLALYALLVDKGFIPASELAKFCAVDGQLGGHPEHKVPGIEASTGSLGHGLSIGVGMAMRAKMDQLDYRVFVLLGDGECDEGSVWEAALSAGKHQLHQLTVMVDYNKHQSYSSTYEVQDLEPFLDKWQAFGFEAVEVNGHDPVALQKLLSATPLNPNKPTAIICHTVKGKGVHFAENNLEWHHKSRISDEDIVALTKALEVADA